MKWWKHMSDLWDGEGVAALVDRKGPTGYGILCRVFDITARAMEKGSGKCSMRYSVTRWSELLSVRGSHVRRWMMEIGLTGVVNVEWIGTDIEVTIPKLLEWRDEYSSRSGHSPDTIPSKSQSQSQSQKTDTEKSTDKSNGAAKRESPADSDDHKTLLERLNLDANVIPKNAASTVAYLERAYKFEGSPPKEAELADWLDVKIEFCKHNGLLYPRAILKRLKQLQRRNPATYAGGRYAHTGNPRL